MAEQASRIENRGIKGVVDFYSYRNYVFVIIANSATIDEKDALVSWLEDTDGNQASHDMVHLTSDEAITYWTQYIDSTSNPLVNTDQRPYDWYSTTEQDRLAAEQK